MMGGTGDQPMTVTDPDALFHQLLSLVCGVNASEYDGKPPGTVLVAQYEVNRPEWDDYRVRVHLIHDPEGWNNLPLMGKGRFPVLDAMGVPPFRPVEFPPKDNGWEWSMTGRGTPDEADAPVTVEAP
jgi:hypothetical protein